MIHIVFEDFIMIKGIYIDNLKSYESLISLVENKFIIERPYFALNCLLAIICSKYLYDEKKINFLGILTISLIIILSLLLIAARLAMGVSVIIFLIILIQEKKVRIKHYILLLVIIIISILTFGKHALERITFKDGEPRIAIWNCVASIIKSNEFNYFVGEFSSQRVNNKLIVCYNSKPVSEGPYWWIGKKRFNYNTHNQFLWFFTSYGIIGLSLFLSIFILQIFNYFKRANFYSLLFVLVFFSQSVFENILCRQLGIYLFVWFSYILLSKKEFSIYE
ncbi:hypothetical protein [Flavobacterium luteum]|uniref:O-antigen ligase family protein n=1 Tax=Flavobacterium luteum TaxID=2026654 RepID=A0A7J5AHQ9_9FLAO|nr:hypothetical protein [Flavobacterium luteum]KAB1157055.1 hypothetical protein F6464_06845 [Flavobacterium luteum]